MLAALGTPYTAIWELSGTLFSLNHFSVLAKIRGVNEYAVDTDSRKVGAGHAPGFVDVISRRSLFFTQRSNPKQLLLEHRYRGAAPRSVKPLLFPEVKWPASTDENGAGVGELNALIKSYLSGHSQPKSIQNTDEKKQENTAALTTWVYKAQGTFSDEGGDISGVTDRRQGQRFVFGAGGVSRSVNIGPCPAWYAGGGTCVGMVTERVVKSGWAGVDERLQRWMAEYGRDWLGSKRVRSKGDGKRANRRRAWRMRSANAFLRS